MQPIDSAARGQVPAAVTQQLLSIVVRIADGQADLANRRLALLQELADVIGADCGFWSWGRGRPDASTVAPVANIGFGFTGNQRAVVIQWGLDAETNRSFQMRILTQMAGARRATTLWHDIYSPEEWAAKSPFRSHLENGGWGSFLHSVRYSDIDTWSNFFLLRNAGKREFEAHDAAAVDIVLNGVSWLHSTAQEYVPPESLAGLTPRQRTVMLLLLDGQARKSIARQLGISEDTVGDHIKSIYAHFQVGSAGELAALFLRDGEESAVIPGFGDARLTVMSGTLPA